MRLGNLLHLSDPSVSLGRHAHETFLGLLKPRRGEGAQRLLQVTQHAEALRRRVGLYGNRRVALGQRGEAHLEPRRGADRVRDVFDVERLRQRLAEPGDVGQPVRAGRRQPRHLPLAARRVLGRRRRRPAEDAPVDEAHRHRGLVDLARDLLDRGRRHGVHVGKVQRPVLLDDAAAGAGQGVDDALRRLCRIARGHDGQQDVALPHEVGV